MIDSRAWYVGDPHRMKTSRLVETSDTINREIFKISNLTRLDAHLVLIDLWFKVQYQIAAPMNYHPKVQMEPGLVLELAFKFEINMRAFTASRGNLNRPYLYVDRRALGFLLLFGMQ